MVQSANVGQPVRNYRWFQFIPGGTFRLKKALFLWDSVIKSSMTGEAAENVRGNAGFRHVSELTRPYQLKDEGKAVCGLLIVWSVTDRARAMGTEHRLITRSSPTVAGRFNIPFTFKILVFVSYRPGSIYELLTLVYL